MDLLKPVENQLLAFYSTSSELGESVQSAMSKIYGKYLRNFFDSSSGLDMLSKGFFVGSGNTVKEITESYSAFHHTYRVLQNFFRTTKISQWNSIYMYDVCSGASPNTAGLFAFKTKWNCFAVDPALNVDLWKERFVSQRIDRITLLKSKVEEIEFQAQSLESICVITLVHGHVKPIEVLRQFSGFKLYILYTLECCVSLNLKYKDPHKYGHDLSIHSPKNKFAVYVFDENERMEMVCK